MEKNPQLQPIFNLIESKKTTPLDQLATLRQAQDQLGMQGIKQQEMGIQETEEKLQQLRASQPDQKNQKLQQMLIGMGDLLGNTGGKGSQIYQMFQNKGDGKQISEMEKLLSQQRQGLSKSELGLLDQQLTGSFRDASLAQQKELAEAKIAADLQKAREKFERKGTPLTPFEKKRDEDFAKVANKWEQEDFAKVSGNLEALRDVSFKLSQPGDLTNTMLPTAFRKYAPGFLGGDTESVAAQQKVEFVVQQSLKEILGGQFSKEEGKQLIQRSFDPALSDAQNKEKLDGLIDRLDAVAKAKNDAISYTKEQGTLKGFEGFKGESLQEYLSGKANDLKTEYNIGGRRERVKAEASPTRPTYKNPKANSLAEEFGL